MDFTLQTIGTKNTLIVFLIIVLIASFEVNYQQQLRPLNGHWFHQVVITATFIVGTIVSSWVGVVMLADLAEWFGKTTSRKTETN